VYRPGERRLLVILLIIQDSLMVAAALWLAFVVRIQSGLLYYGAPYDPQVYATMVLVSVLGWLLIFASLRLYDPAILLGGPTEYGQVVKGCSFGALALVAISFFWREPFTLSRLWLLFSWAFSIVLVGGGRFLFRRFAFWLRRRYGMFVTRVLIVGNNEQGKALARQWSRAPGYEVVGFVDDFLPAGTQVTQSLYVLGPPRFLGRIAREKAVDEVVVVPNAVAWETFDEVIRQSAQQNGYGVKLAPGFYGTLTTGVEVVNRGFVPLLAVQQTRITGLDSFLKTLLDYVGGCLALVCCTPLMLLVALGLKLTAPRRPLFVFPRVYGRGGGLFTTWKFDVAEDGDDSLGARFRRFLYSAGLDKLPQLANVLAGQMSLVGPRTISEVEAPHFRRWLSNLLTVKPGITGVWAISDQSSIEDQVRAKMYYIRNWTIWLDLQVLFHTMLRVLRKERGRAALLPIEDVELDGLPYLDIERKEPVAESSHELRRG
jgi:lipopolysaccharide/colanic/teichoic acid biosynthesis glycosyltransferase